MSMLEKLMSFTNREIQRWLTRVGQEGARTLAMALLGEDEEVQGRVLRNMSKNAGAKLSEYIREYAETGSNESQIQASAKALERLM
jgi:flagellar motor switch protein FliG